MIAMTVIAMTKVRGRRPVERRSRGQQAADEAHP
jgi:hypothetical protein